MYALINVINFVFQGYLFVIIGQVLVGWLIAFEVLNVNNPQARNLVALLHKLTDPVYRPLRKYIPAIGGIDITPILVIIGLQILQRFIVETLVSL